MSVVIYPRMLTAAALQGMTNAIGALKESMRTGAVVDKPELLYSFEDLNALMGYHTLLDMEQAYLTEAQKQAKYGAA